MVEILDIFHALDGVDVTIRLNDGNKHVFHFVSEPDNIQDAVDGLVAQIQPEVVIIVEDGTTI